MQSSILLIRRFIINSSELENLINYYRDGKLAHAYLISTNNIDKCKEVLLKVIKNIFCVLEYSQNCNKCSLCHLIDINTLPSLRIIYPDGNFIKKDQILELKNLFAKASQFTKESIYIIVNAEKMNKEAANTMLKFLEEPQGNVIGFFITNHKENIMPTISSRCQLLKLNFATELYDQLGISLEKYNEYEEVVKNYLSKIETEKSKSILYNGEYLSNYEKEDIKVIFQIILKKYLSVLENKLLKRETQNISDYTFLNQLNIDNLKKKINLIIEILNEINYNINVNLMLDKFVIEMDGINNESI